MTPEQAKLVTDHLWLARYIAIQMAQKMPRYIQVDDLAGYGSIGLIRAARQYDPSRSSFRTWAAKCIHTAIRDAMNIEARQRRGECEAGTERTCPRSSKAMTELASRESARHLLRRLCRSQRVALWLRYVEGLEFGEIGQSMDFCESRAFQLCRAGIRNLMAQPIQG